MLGGVALITAFLYLSYPERADTPVLAWNAETAKAEIGSAVGAGQGLQFTLDKSGRGVLILPVPAAEAGQYTSLHLQFARPPAANSLGVFWETTETGRQMVQHWVPGTIAESFFLGLGGMNLWAGKVLELAILIQGKPGEQFLLEAIELRPASLVDDVLAVTASWRAFVAWNTSSINTYKGTSSVEAARHPATVFGALFGASLLVYGLLLYLSRARVLPDWRVVSTLFIICWLCLDLPWQGKLWQQLAETREQFSGRDSAAKLAVGPDSALVRFMLDVQQSIGPADARIFVATGNDYLGMRGSYYLYPYNVFWARRGSELPPRETIQKGDYIVVIHPSAIDFDPRENVIRAWGTETLPVELVASGGLGLLLRVM